MESKTVGEVEGNRTGEGLVDEDAVAAYASAVNDPNPRYRDGRAVPLLFTSGLVLDEYHAVHSGLAVASQVRDHSLSVHGQHDVYLWEPVVPGRRCRWAVSARSARRTKGGVLLTVTARITDLAGAPLLEHVWSTFYLGGTIPAEVGPPVPDHTFPEWARAATPQTRTVRIDRDQAYRFGGVTGDRAPHAMDDDRARSEGFPGKILQGMCTFGMASGVLVNLLAGGDPERVARIAVRFSAPTRPGGELTVDAYEAGRTDGGAASYAFEAHQGGTPVLRHGRLELRP